MRPATDTTDPVALIDRLNADAIRAELDQLYEREVALRAALRVARARERIHRRGRNPKTAALRAHVKEDHP
jgi:hypothetical protein